MSKYSFMNSRVRAVYEEIKNDFIIANKRVTPEFVAQNPDIVYNYIILGDMYPGLSQEFPDEHYWNDYFYAKSISDDTDKKLKLFKNSADCGNPYSAYIYASMIYGDKKYEKSYVEKYFEIAASYGHLEAIVILLTKLYVDGYDGICDYVYFSKKDIHSYLNKAMPYMYYLEQSGDKTHISIVCDIYIHAHNNKYPSKKNEISYLQRSRIHRLENRIDINSEIYVDLYEDAAEKMCESYKELYAKYVDLKKLQSQTFESVCKNIVSEYM